MLTWEVAALRDGEKQGPLRPGLFNVSHIIRRSISWHDACESHISDQSRGQKLVSLERSQHRICAIQLTTQAGGAFWSCCLNKICATNIVLKNDLNNEVVLYWCGCVKTFATCVTYNDENHRWENQRLSVLYPLLGTKCCRDVSQMVGGE